MRKKTIEKIYPELGRHMQELRQDAGLTQAATATRMHITRNNLALIENGRQRIHLHTVIAFGRAVGMSVRHILSEIAP
jgi:DNA-binding XRE family transcriptional regulator